MNDIEHQLSQLQGLLTASDFDDLPLSARVLDRLTAIIVLTHELLAEFQFEEANAMLWIEPHIQRVYDDVDLLIRRLSQ